MMRKKLLYILLLCLSFYSCTKKKEYSGVLRVQRGIHYSGDKYYDVNLSTSDRRIITLKNDRGFSKKYIIESIQLDEVDSIFQNFFYVYTLFQSKIDENIGTDSFTDDKVILHKPRKSLGGKVKRYKGAYIMDDGRPINVNITTHNDNVIGLSGSSLGYFLDLK